MTDSNDNNDACTNIDILQLGYQKLTMSILQQHMGDENGNNNKNHQPRGFIIKANG